MKTEEMLSERLTLALDRIYEIVEEHFGNEALDRYFARVASFLVQIDQTRLFLQEGGLQSASLEELLDRNHALYEDILEENYSQSFANTTYAVEKLGEQFGALLAFLYTEMRSLIGFVHEGKTFDLVIRMELFLEVLVLIFILSI